MQPDPSEVRQLSAGGTHGPLHPLVARHLSGSAPPAPTPPSVEEAVALVRAEHLATTAAVVGRETFELSIRDHWVPVAGRPMTLREYREPACGLRPAMVFLHGGGWVTGTVDAYDDLCSRLAIALGGAVYSAGYRLAPEVRFPGAVEDADAAARWLLSHAVDLDVDPHRVWVAGDSAGGTLAAATARRLRDDPPADGRSIAGQVLFYPVTDGAMETASYRELGHGYGLTAERMRWYWDQYCPDLVARANLDASPLRVADASGLPRLVLVVASHDPLIDEGMAYAAKLEAAGVPVSVTVASGFVHGFLRWTAILDEAREFIGKSAGIVRDWV